MSGTKDTVKVETSSETKNTFRDLAKDSMRDWITSLVNSSGLLIAIPLLILSFLASLSQFRGAVIALVAVPIIASSIMFAVDIYFASKSQQGLAFSAVSILENWESPKMADARVRATVKDIRRAEQFFQLGLAVLIASFVVLAVVLVLTI